MKMQLAVIGLVSCAIAAAQNASDAADTILTNGQIYAAGGQWAEALAIKRGVIVALGDNAKVQSYRGPNSKVMDLQGRTVLPGFHDMHVHPLGAGELLRSCVLKREAAPSEIRATVSACAAKAKPGEWITGGSWVNDVFKAEPQDRALLDEAAPNNPVVLSDETYHSTWVNSMALKVAGITKDTPNPLNGVIEHRANGEPNGLLRESASNLVRAKIPPSTAEDDAAALRLALQTMLASGITSLQDAMASRQTLTAFALLADRGELKQRVKECLGWSYHAEGVDPNFEAIYNERNLYRRDRLEPSCVKIVGDGVPGEGHTAGMIEPYMAPVPGDTDDARRYGILNVPQNVLDSVVTRFDKDGMSVVIHCTGDACAKEAVNAIASARRANGWSGVLHQIAHNDFTTAEDLMRGRQIGATFEYSAYLYYWNGVTRTYFKAVGAKPFERFKPVQETIADGAIALEGSDWPVSPTPNPWIAIETLITRRRPGGGGDEPALAPNQAITMKDAIDIYTVNAAKQFGNADRVGSIKPGLFADLIVVDRNPFKVPITTVHDTKVETAIINGEVVYEGR